MSEDNSDFERLIETSKFPVELVSEKSAREKSGGGTPPYWEMVFWWTRKPLAGARAIIAGALVPSNANVNEFVRALRLNEKSPHRHNPVLPEKWRKWFEGKSLLDPFAGFGSIPLEALRLGLSKVVAVELLPTAYVFLKAILEYPLKYGKQLIKDVEKWGNWVTEQLRRDPIIQKLYDPDVAVYIGSWEIKCPHCGKWTPLIGNWWLARVSKEVNGRKEFIRLAWMQPKIEDDTIFITVNELNGSSKVNKLSNIKVDTKRGIISLSSGKLVNVPKPNIDSRKEVAICLHCNNAIRCIDIKTGKHYSSVPKRSKYSGRRLIWYVKYALKKYNEGDDSLCRQILLVKVKKGSRKLKFEPCEKKDRQKLEIAKREVEKLQQRADPDIPVELVAPWGSRGMGGDIKTIVWGLTSWDKHFNSRQIFTLTKLVKLIREVGHKIEEEKEKEGFSPVEAKNYAEAVTVYLAIALCKCADFDSITTRWNPGWLKFEESLSVRGIAMMWNWTESNPFATITGTWKSSLANAINGLKFLIDSLQKGMENLQLLNTINNDEKEHSFRDVIVVLDDAAVLSKLGLDDQKFDIIVSDPPYYDDVPYTELSDFYYVWLKRALSDIKEGRLAPRFLTEAFFKRIGAKFVEIKTQWEEFAKQEVSMNPGRFENVKNKVETARNHFLTLLSRSFIAMKQFLKDKGLLVTYYAHTSPDAWIALLEAGWRNSKCFIISAFPIATESIKRVTARGKYALDTSIIVVWRKGASGSSSAEELYEKAVDRGRSAALNLIRTNRMGSDLFVGTMASILSVFTRYENVYGPTGLLDVKSLVTDYVYPATAKALAMALGELAQTPGEIKRSESLFYLITKALFPKPPKSKRKLDRTNIALLCIGTKADKDALQKFKILRKEKEDFYLEEPLSDDRKSFEEFLRRRNVNPSKPLIESPVDALHLLEYFAQTLPLKLFLVKFSQLREEYSSEAEEAINLAAILAKVLPSTDPEKKACEEIIARIKGEKLA